MFRWLSVSTVVVVLDQATKMLAEQRLEFHSPQALLPSLNLTLAYNRGAAFSFLSGAGGWQRWFFSVLAVVVSVIIIGWIRRLAPGQRWTALGLALVLGGALGNLIDRLLYGHVIDFIDVYYGSWHWPTFNLADTAISVGAVLVLITQFFGGRSQHDAPSSPGS